MSTFWRSLLYVPANVPRFVEKAHTRGADCIILDLEDSVPVSEKASARNAIESALAHVRLGGGDVAVRINAGMAAAAADLEFAIRPGVDAIVVSKARGPDHIQLIDELIDELEAKAGVATGSTKLILLIETPDALSHAASVGRASKRNVAMALGGEDFAASIGADATEETLAVPKQLALHAARAAGLSPIGLIGSMAGFKDIAAFEALARRSRAMGFEGASCVNPAQVPALNAAFTPSEADCENARRVLDVLNAALREGRGSAQLDGKMIDAPVAARAQRLLDRASSIAQRESIA
ncbi:MAG: CoA ester lyase [Caulobacterales bacterium]